MARIYEMLMVMFGKGEVTEEEFARLLLLIKTYAMIEEAMFAQVRAERVRADAAISTANAAMARADAERERAELEKARANVLDSRVELEKARAEAAEARVLEI